MSQKGVYTNIQLYHRRKEKHLTQKELASKAKISLSHYQYIEAGKKEPTISKAFRIAKVLNCDVAELFK